ncbi:actin remodeling regulator NHS isoform X2 [Engraulis encrasicolus]|uniref:actin remodeling regulator NHS isoform X2 n=1 Tax=Engraulis encrasicolus TaxID=184585 RepID=UPI002FD61E58
MPFAKRIVEPQLLCRHTIPNEEGLLFEDLCTINNVALSRTLRQLSDLAKHACSLFQDLENDIVSTNERVWVLHSKIGRLQLTTTGLDPKQEAVPVSNLDVESKLTSHYQAPWHQQRNVFHPSSRPACVEELHRHAKLSLRALQRDQHARQQANISRERRVTINIAVAPPMPTYPSPRTLRRRQQKARHLETFHSTRPPSPTECCHFSPWRKAAPSADPDSEVVALGHRPKVPIPNVPSTLDKQTNWSQPLPLPTPEERMKNDSQVINSCVVPINVTGVGFDRDASVRCSLVHSQSVLQRRRKLRRRKTISGIPRRVQQDLDSDESPVSRERTVIVHVSPESCQEGGSGGEGGGGEDGDTLSSRLSTTKDSGCQTEDVLIAATAPSRRRIRSQRGGAAGGGQCVTVVTIAGVPHSHSTGNISSLPCDDSLDAMYSSTSVGARLRSRSLPRDGRHLVDEDHDDSDEDDEEEEEGEEELSPFEAEDFLSLPGVAGEHILKDEEEEESTDDQALPEHRHHQLGGLPFDHHQHTGSPEHGWLDRGRSRLPRKADMGSCEISSSSDTFSSPIHSVSNAGVLTSQLDHKEDHQSSSGNWSGSSSTCPSQTSETIPPLAASPPLTGSSHCDSELSLNAASHANDDTAGFILDPYPLAEARLTTQVLRGHRAGSFTSTATDVLDDAGVSTASEGEWGYPHHHHQQHPHHHHHHHLRLSASCHQDFSPEHSREEEEVSLECPSFTSIATLESLLDKPPSDKADTVSHYSVDNEGYYTSMHFDCGLKESKSFTYNYAAQEQRQQVEYGRVHSALGLASSKNCLSLRKPKAKPPPPARSTSLKRISGGGGGGGGCPHSKSEPKMSSSGGQNLPMSPREKRMQLELPPSSSSSSSGQPEVEETLEAWGVQSGSNMPDVTLFVSGETHSFKDEGAVQSDYADLWLLNDLKSSDPYRSLSNSSTATGTTVIECIKSQESSESQTSQSGSRATTPSLPSVENDFKLPSPEKLIGLASPSSGYSSQSETPTSTFPSAFFPSPLSPASGKRKPKVPERKSSLSSLQQHSSKKELELPVIPPTHLDLSALHNINKPSAPRNQLHVLHQTKKKAVVATAVVATATKAANRVPATAETFAPPAPMAITPNVLRSVQLRSVGKPSLEGSSEKLGVDTATRPKCPTVTVSTTNIPANANTNINTNTKPLESRKPPPYRPQETLAQEHCESMFTPGNRSVAKDMAKDVVTSSSAARLKVDKERPAPQWSMTAFRAQKDGDKVEVDSFDSGIEGQGASEVSIGLDEETPGLGVTKSLSMGYSTDGELSEALKHEPQEKSWTLSLSDSGSVLPTYHGTAAKRSESLDQVPDIISQSETLQANTISDAVSKEADNPSGVPTRSASQESKDDGSTPDTEDYFSKESTPSDPTVSPQNDESKVDDDSVFLSPNRSRTTEDLFAMIHRSKRKVLGRKDSADLSGRNRLGGASASNPPGNTLTSPTTSTPTSPTSTPTATTPSTPTTPNTPSTPTSSSQRASGQIYRSAKKSSTSNEEFKLLLLKKGSRSDSSYRMSATEILKSPVAPKSPGDVFGGQQTTAEATSPQHQQPQSPLGGSGGATPDQLPSPFPKANTEGFSPKAFPPTTASSRQGRSRIPPAANSSRYSARSRLYTAPMQAISEGETENSDSSPHDDRSS